MPSCRHKEEVRRLTAKLIAVRNVFKINLRRERRKAKEANRQLYKMRERLAALDNDLTITMNNNNRAISRHMTMMNSMLNEWPVNGDRGTGSRITIDERRVVRRRPIPTATVTREESSDDDEYRPVTRAANENPISMVESSDEDLRQQPTGTANENPISMVEPSDEDFRTVTREGSSDTIMIDDESSDDEYRSSRVMRRRNPVRGTRINRPSLYTELSDDDVGERRNPVRGTRINRPSLYTELSDDDVGEELEMSYEPPVYEEEQRNQNERLRNQNERINVGADPGRWR